MNRSASPWRLCVAPMMDWTDRHCRYFHRLLTPPRAALHRDGDDRRAAARRRAAPSRLRSRDEQPVALQLGGSEPAELAACARLGERWGYAEINLNCGCPSERVQRGAFGACLMAEPALVADCVRAMRDAVALPVTVKHRIGIDRDESYEFVRDFVGTVARRAAARSSSSTPATPGCRASARRRTASCRRCATRSSRALKQRLPGARRSSSTAASRATSEIDAQLAARRRRDGRPRGLSPSVATGRLGRALLRRRRRATSTRDDGRGGDGRLHGAPGRAGEPWSHASRHMLGLRNGEPGARRWRQVWSDARLKGEAPATVVAPRASGARQHGRDRRRRRAGHAASTTPASASANAAACAVVNSSP